MSFWLPMELYDRFANAAKAKGLHMSEYLVQLMQTASEGTPVTPEQTADMLRRVKCATVTHADVALALANNVLEMTEKVADTVLRHPLANPRSHREMNLKPIPRKGSRKKRR